MEKKAAEHQIPTINEVNSFIHNSDILNICDEFHKAKDLFKKSEFNIFTLTSDLYYRENYHSDIIRAFLDPQGGHGEGNTFLNLFIDLLNKQIEHDQYADAEVVREHSKIDILIKSDKNKRCIIIENKINDAPDMPEQLLRYLKKNGVRRL